MGGTDGEKSRKKIKKSYSSLLLHYLLTRKTCSESKHTQNRFCLLARSSATSRLQFPMFYQSPRWIHFLFFIFIVEFCMPTSFWRDNHWNRTEAWRGIGEKYYVYGMRKLSVRNRQTDRRKVIGRWFGFWCPRQCFEIPPPQVCQVLVVVPRGDELSWVPVTSIRKGTTRGDELSWVPVTSIRKSEMMIVGLLTS